MTPIGEFQATWLILAVFRLWDSSQSPAWKVWQVLAVPAAQPPHAVYPDWECRYLPGEGRSGSLHPHPSGRITSTKCWASDSVFSPPVTKIPRHIYRYHCVLFSCKYLPGAKGISALQLLSTAPLAMYWIQCLTSVTRAYTPWLGHSLP